MNNKELVAAFHAKWLNPLDFNKAFIDVHAPEALRPYIKSILVTRGKRKGFVRTSINSKWDDDTKAVWYAVAGTINPRFSGMWHAMMVKTSTRAECEDWIINSQLVRYWILSWCHGVNDMQLVRAQHAKRFIVARIMVEGLES